MRRLNKLFTLLFVAILTLGGGGAAFAAPGTRPENGDLTIHKYWAETANDIGVEGNGKEVSGITNPAVAGIKFDVYLLEKENATTPDTPPSDKDGWVYSRTGTELTVKKDAIEYKYTLHEQTADGTFADGKTNTNGELKYSNLPAGYYYVEENLAASTGYQVQGKDNAGKTITSAAKPFIVAVPMTSPDGDAWNTDVHVYPKNQGLSAEKKPDVPSITVGDKVEWTISANVPSDIADYQKFDVIDELDQRLNYVDDSVKIVGLNDSGSEIVSLISPTDFGVTPSPAAGSVKEKIVISLTADGIKKLGTNNVVKVVITFATTVNGNMANGAGNIIENTANIEFDNGSTTDTDKSTTGTVHTGTIKINKTYSGTVTESAQFQLAKEEADAENGNYLRVVLDGDNNYIKAIVAPGETGYDTAKKWIALPTETDDTKLGLKADTFYVNSFEGLQTYTETGTGDTSVKDFNSYYLTETKAPEGYNLLDKPLEIKFVEADKDTKYVHTTDEIENKKGFTLPNTGGVGTLLLVVAGIVLIGLAIILTMNKKKTA